MTPAQLTPSTKSGQPTMQERQQSIEALFDAGHQALSAGESAAPDLDVAGELVSRGNELVDLSLFACAFCDLPGVGVARRDGYFQRSRAEFAHDAVWKSSPASSSRQDNAGDCAYFLAPLLRHDVAIEACKVAIDRIGVSPSSAWSTDDALASGPPSGTVDDACGISTDTAELRATDGCADRRCVQWQRVAQSGSGQGAGHQTRSGGRCPSLRATRGAMGRGDTTLSDDLLPSDDARQTWAESLVTVPPPDEPEPAREALSQMGPYRVLQRLGAGAMGTVYEALDTRTDLPVALKVLSRVGPAEIRRLKREFRSLVGVSHPNLVRMFELGRQGDTWYFTMELVEGVNLLRYVREGLPDGLGPLPVAALRRLDACLRQLVAGVVAVHERGLLHLDLKPENILVAPDGRLVVLDFGLVQSFTHTGLERRGVRGTPLYMSPEQAAVDVLGPEADWYAVGAVLYHLMTGVPPFRASSVERLLSIRCEQDGEAPSVHVPMWSGDPLDALCAQLLRRAHAERPTGADVMERLDMPGHRPSPGRRVGLVGQREAMDTLQEAFHRAREHGPVVAWLEGPAGSGKSHLGGAFAKWAEGAGATVLSGRCFEQDTTVFRALDPVVDELAVLLEARRVRPEPLAISGEVARAFPTLSPFVARGPAAPGCDTDPHRSLEELAAGLSGLLAAVAEGGPLVVFVDDLHWGDSDSGRLLLELLLWPPPRLLLVVAARNERSRPGLEAELRLAARRLVPPGAWFEVVLGALNARDSEYLARLWLPHDARQLAERVAREAGGNPMWIERLARFVSTEGARGGAAMTFADLVMWQVSTISKPCRSTLELLTLAGRPLDRASLAGLSERPLDETLLGPLRQARLIRTEGLADEDLIDIFHDSVREVVLAWMPPSHRRALHARFVAQLDQATDGVELDRLAVHLHGMGDLERAATAAVLAAEAAERALAFHQAAEWYERALAWAPETDRVGRMRRRADALRLAGQLTEAGTQYRALLELEPKDAAELATLGADCFLTSGLIDDGVRLLTPLLAQAGMAARRHPVWTTIGVMARISWFAFRFPRWSPPSTAGSTDTRLVQLCWSLGKGLGNVEPLGGASFFLVSLQLSLRHGAPGWAARGGAYLGALLAAMGAPGQARAQRVFDHAERLAAEAGDDEARGLVLVYRGIACTFGGDWSGARALADRGIEVLERECVGAHWGVTVGVGCALLALDHTGQGREVASRARRWVRESADRGDLYGATTAGLYAAACRIAEDEPEQAISEASELLRRWNQPGYTVQELYVLRVMVQALVYRNEVSEAMARLESEWPKLSASGLLRIPVSRIDAVALRGRTHLAALLAGCAEADRRVVERCARQLQREARSDARAHGLLLAAGNLSSCGQTTSVRDLVTGAHDLYTRSGARHYAALCDTWLHAGTSASARSVLHDSGVVHPGRWARLVAPGLSVFPLQEGEVGVEAEVGLDPVGTV